MKIICGPLKVVPWCFSYSIIRGKIGQKLLSSQRKLFLQMFVSINLLGSKKCYYHLHNQCQNTLRTLINCSLSIFMFDETRKKRPKSFLHWKGCLVSHNFVFSTTFVPKKRSFIFQNNWQISLWALKSCPLRFFTSDTRRKNGQKLLSSWKQLFFEMLVPSDPLGPKEIIWLIAQKSSTKLVYL